MKPVKKMRKGERTGLEWIGAPRRTGPYLLTGNKAHGPHMGFVLAWRLRLSGPTISRGQPVGLRLLIIDVAPSVAKSEKEMATVVSLSLMVHLCSYTEILFI
jgi:hypothetical protein